MNLMDDTLVPCSRCEGYAKIPNLKIDRALDGKWPGESLRMTAECTRCQSDVTLVVTVMRKEKLDTGL